MKIRLSELRRLIREALEVLSDRHIDEMWKDLVRFLVSPVKNVGKLEVLNSSFQEVFDSYCPGFNVEKSQTVVEFRKKFFAVCLFYRELLKQAGNDKIKIKQANNAVTKKLTVLKPEFHTLIDRLNKFVSQERSEPLRFRVSVD